MRDTGVLRETRAQSLEMGRSAPATSWLASIPELVMRRSDDENGTHVAVPGLKYLHNEG